MKKPFATLRYFPFCLLIIFFAGCGDTPPDDVYKLLEEKAKVKTFPLTVVLTEPLAGEEFPEDLRTLCRFSSAVCKTLPTAGILRLGPDQYFTFNAIASLNVNSEDGDDEATIAQSVQKQVSTYYLKTKLRDFDSLRSANNAEFNYRALTTQYVQNNKDSIFFFSARASDPSLVFFGNRSFTVYKNVAELRRIIDDQICKNPISISVFYTPSSTASGAVPTGMFAGDTCVGGSRFEKLNDGKGNLFVGKLIEKNSKSCGFSFPTGVAGDTCINFSKYQKLHDGRGGFKAGELLEKNSQACGYTPPKTQAETNVRISTGSKPDNAASKAPVVTTQPVKTAPLPRAQPVQNSAAATVPKTPTVRVNSGGSTPATQPVRVNAATTRSGTATGQPGRQSSGAPTGAVVTSTSAPAEPPADRRCAKTSDPMCEQDERGNYTGRRIQYCYNSAGKVVRTIVLKKCDGDCRCLGD